MDEQGELWIKIGISQESLTNGLISTSQRSVPSALRAPSGVAKPGHARCTRKANFLLGFLREILRIASWLCLMSSAPWREPLRISLTNGRMSPRFGMPFATRWMNRRKADATSLQVHRLRRRRACFIPEPDGSRVWPCIPCPCRKVDILLVSFLSRTFARGGKSAYSRFKSRPWTNLLNS